MGFSIIIPETWNPNEANGFNKWIKKVNNHAIKSRYNDRDRKKNIQKKKKGS